MCLLAGERYLERGLATINCLTLSSSEAPAARNQHGKLTP